MDKEVEYTIQLKSALLLPVEITISIEELEKNPVIELESSPNYYNIETLESCK